MIRMLRKEGIGVVIGLNQLEEGEEEKRDEFGQCSKFLKGHITYFKGVFQAPVRLPPHRGHGHTINLKEGTNPVSVRPY